jgi:hypothetical protein
MKGFRIVQGRRLVRKAIALPLIPENYTPGRVCAGTGAVRASAIFSRMIWFISPSIMDVLDTFFLY